MAGHSGVFTRVVIFDEHLYVPGGIVYDWMRDVGKEMSRNSKAVCPRRSGTLKKSIRMSMRGLVSGKTVQTTIGTNVPYANYVLKGTRGPIMSDAAWALGGKIGWGRGMKEYRKKVQGRSRWSRSGMITARFMVPDNVMMPVGKSQGKGKIVMRLRVDGQIATNFLAAGYRMTRAHHSALPWDSPV